MATASRTCMWMDGLLATRRSHAEDGGKEPGALEAQILLGRALALDLEIVGQELDDLSARFATQKFCESARPSVTRRDRSKLAPEVAARFLSFNSLLASVLASKSEVRSARAGRLGGSRGETGETEGARAWSRSPSSSSAPWPRR